MGGLPPCVSDGTGALCPLIGVERSSHHRNQIVEDVKQWLSLDDLGLG
jgi:hypothetical protein